MEASQNISGPRLYGDCGKSALSCFWQDFTPTRDRKFRRSKGTAAGETVGAVYERANELKLRRLFPSSQRRDGRATNKNGSVPKRRGRGGQFGETVQAWRFRRADHYYGFALSRSRIAPVCGAYGGFGVPGQAWFIS